MGKYKARGGGSGYLLAGVVLIISVGLIGLTVWLVIKNTKPATCDITVNKVTIASAPASGSTTYPVTIDYSGNGSNACAAAQAEFTVNIGYPDKTTDVLSTQQPVSQGVATVEATKAGGVLTTVNYYIRNPDGSQGPAHSYP